MQILNKNLRIRTEFNRNDNPTDVSVTYLIQLSPLELFLMQHGLAYREEITVMGRDGKTDQVLFDFPVQTISRAVGVVVDRNRSVTVPLRRLNEDPGIGQADEIRCRIRLVSNLSADLTDFTETETITNAVADR